MSLKRMVDANTCIVTIRSAADYDTAVILALNAESVHYLSPMDAQRYEALRAMSAHVRVAEHEGDVLAFLLAFSQGTAYDSPNYEWFSQRYDRFLYVDRIAVAQRMQGSGIGRRLYQDIFAYARQCGIPRIVAEFYTTPPNEVSRKFHASFGFQEVGSQPVFETKVVSLQVAEL